jgi:hypothetical protein
MKTIEILIDPQGGVRIQSKGIAGSSCRDATRPFEIALGVRQSEQLTAEFHLQSEANVQVRTSN